MSKASGPDCIPVVVLKNFEPEFSYIPAELFNKAWFSPIKLMYSHLYSYENKNNPVGGNTSNNLKNDYLTTFHEIIHLFSQE